MLLDVVICCVVCVCVCAALTAMRCLAEEDLSKRGRLNSDVLFLQVKLTTVGFQQDGSFAWSRHGAILGEKIEGRRAGPGNT